MRPTLRNHFILAMSLALIFFMSLLAALAASAPGDEHWDPQFGPAGANNNLYAVSVSGNKVYVGGYLTAAGNTRANFVAGYSGTNWFALNNGVSGGAGTTVIFALTADGTNLYAGGWFTNADNSGARYIARWDGTNWSPLGGGVAGIIAAIKINGTNLYVGGSFTAAGGISVNGITRWDGTSWQPLGTGVSGCTGSFCSANVSCLAFQGSDVYAGGNFVTAGGISASYVARYDGSSWHALGTTINGPINALSFHGGYLYAGGAFTNSSAGLTNIARWDGASWSAVPGGGANSQVLSLITNGAALYVGGGFTQVGGIAANHIAKWDGSAWAPLGTGIQGFGAGGSLGVYQMAWDPAGRLYVAGNFNVAGTAGASHVAGWDGTNWFALGGATSKGLTHFGRTVNCFAADGTNLYAGGTFTEAGSNIVNGIAKWNGANWAALGSGVIGSGSVQALAVTGAVVYAGGNFTNMGGTTVRYMAMWNGSNWASVGNGFNGTVKALAFHRGVLFAGGSFTARGDLAADFHGIAQFDGSDWAGVPVISSWRINNSFNALASDGTNLFVGGDFYIGWGFAPPNPSLGADLDYVGRWDGTNWWSLGTELNAAVSALALQNGSLYAGGIFTSNYSGGTPEKRIARWNGVSWTTVGNGFTNGSVLALAATPTTLYAAGSFTNAAPSAFSQIARWNGTNWAALGSGLLMSPGSPSGNALALLGNNLYLGGQFLFAGDQPAISMVRWNDQLNFYPPPNLQLTRTRWLANSQFQCRIAGTSGETYILQGSTNLNTWTPLTTNTATLYDFTDTNAAALPKRFYRALLQP